MLALSQKTWGQTQALQSPYPVERGNEIMSPSPGFLIQIME